MKKGHVPWLRQLGLVATLAVLGCGAAADKGQASATDTTLDTAAEVTAQPDVAANDAATAASDAGQGADTAQNSEDASPKAPCGSQVGDELCDLGLQGYLRNETTGLASSVEFGTALSLAEVMAKSTPKYAVIVLGAWW